MTGLCGEGQLWPLLTPYPENKLRVPRGWGWGAKGLAFLGTSALCLGVPDVFVYWQKGTGLAPPSQISFPAFVTSDNARLSRPPLERMGVPQAHPSPSRP